jgi:hypothetical protein
MLAERMPPLPLLFSALLFSLYSFLLCSTCVHVFCFLVVHEPCGSLFLDMVVWCASALRQLCARLSTCGAPGLLVKRREVKLAAADLQTVRPIMAAHPLPTRSLFCCRWRYVCAGWSLLLSLCGLPCNELEPFAFTFRVYPFVALLLSSHLSANPHFLLSLCPLKWLVGWLAVPR